MGRLYMIIALMAVTISLSTTAYAKDVSILFLGSNRSAPNNKSQAFNTQSVAKELEKILGGVDSIGKVRVDFEELGAPGSPYGNLITYRYHAMGRWGYQSHRMKGEGDATDRDNRRLPLLRGETRRYDYVVILDNPAVIENMPGQYMQGVKLIAAEIKKSKAEPILLMSWPGAKSPSTIDYYKEVVYRTGRALGIKVAPAALAWKKEGSKHGKTHPTADGAYIAAASIYSQIYGKSATGSTYNSDKRTVAEGVQTIVKAHSGTKYSGRFNWKDNPNKIIFFQKRFWSISHTAKSTESTLKGAITRLAEADWNRLLVNGSKHGFGGMRGIHHWRDPKAISKSYQLSYFFIHPGNGGYPSLKVAYDTYGGTSYYPFIRMSLDRGKARYIPTATMWLQIAPKFPKAKFMHAGHIGTPTNLTAAYQLTQLTGRCPLPPKPDPVTVEWACWKLAYETAWRNHTLQDRAPGFKAVPSNKKRMTVDPLSPETMKAYFVFPPEKNVTVTLSTNQSWAAISPKTITFTPENYKEVVDVTVSVAKTAPRGKPFEVVYKTTSNDEVCHDLTESWGYFVNQIPPKPEAVKASAISGKQKQIELKASDPDQLQTVAAVKGQKPKHGTVVYEGKYAFYTPNEDFQGTDTFTYIGYDGHTQGKEEATVTVTVAAPNSYGVNLIVNSTADRTPLSQNGWAGNWKAVGDGDKYFGGSGKALESYQDINISHYAATINGDGQEFKYGADRERIKKNAATQSLELQFRDSGNKVLKTYQKKMDSTGGWSREVVKAPAQAVVARFIIRGDRGKRQNLITSFKGVELLAIKPGNTAPVAVDPPKACVAKGIPGTIQLMGTDADRTPTDTLTYILVDKPKKGILTGWSGGRPKYAPHRKFEGTDSFTYKVFDGYVESENVATVTISVQKNHPPTIVLNSPKKEQVHFTLTSWLMIDANITDDGAPIKPGSVTSKWSVVSAPAGAKVAFSSPDSEKTAVRWSNPSTPSIPGDYVFRLTANDGSKSSHLDVKVTVHKASSYDKPDNIAPQIDVNQSPAAGVIGKPIALKGADLTDIPGKKITYTWQQVTGPGSASFDDANDLLTKVFFDKKGTYKLRLTGDDGIVTSYEDLTIIVDTP